MQAGGGGGGGGGGLKPKQFDWCKRGWKNRYAMLDEFNEALLSWGLAFSEGVGRFVSGYITVCTAHLTVRKVRPSSLLYCQFKMVNVYTRQLWSARILG